MKWTMKTKTMGNKIKLSISNMGELKLNFNPNQMANLQKQHTHTYTHTIKLPYVGNEIEVKWENKVIWQIKFNGNKICIKEEKKKTFLLLLHSRNKCPWKHTSMWGIIEFVVW